MFVVCSLPRQVSCHDVFACLILIEKCYMYHFSTVVAGSYPSRLAARSINLEIASSSACARCSASTVVRLFLSRIFRASTTADACFSHPPRHGRAIFAETFRTIYTRHDDCLVRLRGSEAKRNFSFLQITSRPARIKKKDIRDWH